MVQLTGKYATSGTLPLNVRAYELKQGSILNKGARKACFFSSDGTDCNFVYDPMHPLLVQYPVTPKMLLLQYLAEKLKARDNLTDIVSVYGDLVTSSMSEAKIDRQSLQDRASSVFAIIREKLYKALTGHEEAVLRCIHESSGEVEETVSHLLPVAHLIVPFQKCEKAGFDAIDYVPEKTLIRLFDKFPELIFDGQVVNAPYSQISLFDENATIRSRNESKERVIAFLKDALRITNNSPIGQKDLKNELARASLSIEFLMGELE